MFQGHGGTAHGVALEQGLSPESILDVSASLSPFPTPEPVLQAFHAAIDDLARYPEIDGRHLREAVAVARGVDVDQVLVGAGSTEFIYLLVRALRPEQVWAYVPTYSDYADAARVMEIPFRSLPCNPEARFSRSLDCFAAEARNGDLLFLCNPNNPTGNWVPPDEILRTVTANPHLRFVIDEAYAAFVGPEASCLSRIETWPENLIVLQSPTKFYTMPGLRLGYCFGPAKVIAHLLDRKAPWTVGAAGLRVGHALLTCADQDQEVRETLLDAKQALSTALTEISGLTLFGDAGNFLLGRLDAPGWSGARLQAACLKSGILIRDAGNFEGLDERYFRIAVRLGEENERVVAAIRQSLQVEV
ncbi:MAG: pyridoxal phosphate-dependent aminotransferase [Planctomycetota bacterium]|jgi:threonine-phosphate decarboxylase